MVGSLVTVWQRIMTAIIFGSIFFGTFFFLPSSYFSILLFFTAVLIIGFEIPRLVFYKSWQFLLMAIYVGMPFLCMTLLNNQTFRPVLLLLFISIFLFDTAAYGMGSLIGKHKIAPTISPKKSWEGFIGGYLAIYSLFIGILLWNQKEIDANTILFLAFTICVFATAGDFFESWLKRKAGIKDSGALLPGHGGLLDRFDAVMFVAPLFYVFRNFLMNLFF